MSLDDDEVFTAPTVGDAIPNDPSQRRVIGVMEFDKQGERFVYEPEENNQDEIIMPVEIKKIDREKVLFKMDKALVRFPEHSKQKENVDLEELMKEDKGFQGSDMGDVNKAFKNNLGNREVGATIDMSKMQSLAKFRIDLPYEKGQEPDKKKEEEADDDY